MKQRRKINVLQIVEGFSLGGAEKKLLELVARMDRNRFNIIVCSLGLGQEIEEEFHRLSDSGIRVVVIPRKGKVDPSLIVKMVRLMRTSKIDVVMTTLFFADVVGAIAGRLSGVKAIFSWETISAPEWLLTRRLWAYRLAVRLHDRVISVSEATARFLVEERGVPAGKVMIIPYGVDTESYRCGNAAEARKRLRLNDDDLIIGMVGRLHPQKGHVYLIEAAGGIVQRFKNVRFVLIGDGGMREELSALVEARGLQDRFLFLGFRDDVSCLVEAFDIFTLPSLYEGLPNVVLEAMASGRPVVATAVDGTKEAVVDGETGILVPPRDAERLEKALCELLADPARARRYGEKGRERVESFFNLKHQVSAFERLYESSYAGGGVPAGVDG